MMVIMDQAKMKNKNQKPEAIKEKIKRWQNEINSGRHDGWVTEYFRKKIEKIKRNLYRS